jgi:transposase
LLRRRVWPDAEGPQGHHLGTERRNPGREGDRQGHRAGVGGGLCCYRPGERSRLIYRTLTYRGRKGELKGFREPELIRLLDAAHQQLQAPIVLVWDRLSLHKTPAIRTAIAARPWLRVYLLPAYAPELNPVEKVWSTMKSSLANLAARTATELTAAVKNRLKRMQYRTGLIDGYFTGTGLPPPTPP